MPFDPDDDIRREESDDLHGIAGGWFIPLTPRWNELTAEQALRVNAAINSLASGVTGVTV